MSTGQDLTRSPLCANWETFFKSHIMKFPNTEARGRSYSFRESQSEALKASEKRDGAMLLISNTGPARQAPWLRVLKTPLLLPGKACLVTAPLAEPSRQHRCAPRQSGDAGPEGRAHAFHRPRQDL